MTMRRKEEPILQAPFFCMAYALGTCDRQRKKQWATDLKLHSGTHSLVQVSRVTNAESGLLNCSQKVGNLPVMFKEEELNCR